MAQLALRFILSNPDVTTVIPGMRRPEHLAANVAAAEAGPLPEELLTRPARASLGPGAVAGLAVLVCGSGGASARRAQSRGRLDPRSRRRPESDGPAAG